MAHWHDFNPWSDKLIYVPDLTELALCVAISSVNKALMLERWEKMGKIDAYILASPSGLHSIGIRYGKEPHEYLSPPADNALVELLIKKYKAKE